jgi:hypothetical protein
MADIISIVNTILANGSTEYATRVPTATRDNFTAVGDAITSYTATTNEFLSALVNRIALTLVRNKTLANNLAPLKKGGVPWGQDIQELFTNPATAETFDATGATLLARHVPDTYSLYHRLNRQDTYTVTVTKQQLQKAFLNVTEMETLINSIVNSLYSGDNFDEFILMKNLLASAVSQSKLKVVAADAVTDEATAKALLKSIKKASLAMTFPCSTFNTYYDNLSTEKKATSKPIITKTEKADQILLIRSDVYEDVNIEYLASVFNLDKANIGAQILPIDNFGTASDGTTTADQTYAMLMDKAFIQVYDNLQEMTDFYNPKGLYWNYYWHHWETLSLSTFANAVAFTHDYTA